MTLRNYFAAKAVQSFLTSNPVHESDVSFLDYAKDAYDIADAMLKAREAK